MVGSVPYYMEYTDLLKQDPVEAVLIALPIELNYHVTRDALQAGKHVMVEKPLAVNLAEAGSMLDLNMATDKVAMIAENCRYRSTFHRAKELLEQDTIGQV